MSPLPAALPPLDVTTPTSVHSALSTGPTLPSHAVPATEQAWTDYTVAPGDTLYDLADQFGATVPALVKRNTLPHGGRWLAPGQHLLVPGSSSQPAQDSSTAQPSTSTPRERTATRVMVRPGDTLSQIAARQGVSVTRIARANGIRNPRLIYPGQQLTVPGAAASRDSSRTSAFPSSASSSTRSPSTTPSSSGSVTVRSGDTLSGIAARHSVSLSALQQANPDLDARRLWVGQKVTVPGSVGSPVRSAPWTEDTIGDRLVDTDVEDTFLHYTYSSQVARSAAANRDYLAGVPVPSRDRTKAMITETARRHGVDPALMLALASQESGWNQRAVSPANAIGIMQVIPSSGEWASGLVGRKLNLLDPKDNITAGTAIMRALLRSAQTEQDAIGGYYQGLASVQRNGLFSDTKHYVASIRALRDRLG